MHLKYCVFSRNPVLRLKIRRYSQKIQIGLMDHFDVCYVNKFRFSGFMSNKKVVFVLSRSK